MLWIEDEADTSLQDYVEPVFAAGYLLDIAVNATDAARLLQENRYDVVIVDLFIHAGTDKAWQNLERDYAKYLGLELLRAIFAPGTSTISLEIPKNWLPTRNVAVYTVVAAPKVHAEIRSLGITDIYVKRLSDLTVLKDIIDAKLAQQSG